MPLAGNLILLRYGIWETAFGYAAGDKECIRNFYMEITWKTASLMTFEDVGSWHYDGCY
jgi:hypothetical protein